MTATAVKKAEAEVAEPKQESYDPGERRGQYWAGWPGEKVTELIGALRKFEHRELTAWERDLLHADDLIKGKARVHSQTRADILEDVHLRHELPIELRQQLMAQKVVAIRNPTSKDIAVEMPGGSGCTILMMPGCGTKKNKLAEPGCHVLNAYEEVFVDRDALRAQGLEVVDYDPTDQNMNPPAGQDGGLPYVGKGRQQIDEKSSLDSPDDPRVITQTQRDDQMMKNPAIREAIVAEIGQHPDRPIPGKAG